MTSFRLVGTNAVLVMKWCGSEADLSSIGFDLPAIVLQDSA